MNICRFPWSWGYPCKMDGLFHGKSQSKMDDLGYPHFRKPPFGNKFVWLPNDSVALGAECFPRAWVTKSLASTSVPGSVVALTSIKSLKSILRQHTHFCKGKVAADRHTSTHPALLLDIFPPPGCHHSVSSCLESTCPKNNQQLQSNTSWQKP